MHINLHVKLAAPRDFRFLRAKLNGIIIWFRSLKSENNCCCCCYDDRIIIMSNHTANRVILFINYHRRRCAHESIIVFGTMFRANARLENYCKTVHYCTCSLDLNNYTRAGRPIKIYFAAPDIFQKLSQKSIFIITIISHYSFRQSFIISTLLLL